MKDSADQFHYTKNYKLDDVSGEEERFIIKEPVYVNTLPDHIVVRIIADVTKSLVEQGLSNDEIEQGVNDAIIAPLYPIITYVCILI